MPLTQLEHFLVLTDDIEATRRFYCDALGLAVGPRPPLAFAGYWLYVGGTPCVHVASARAMKARPARSASCFGRLPGTGPFDHVAFNATDFDAVRARLEGQNVPVHVNVVPGVGLRQLFVFDPNGVKVEINIPA
jgi:catechol 2,3-dioxygenase-like lactoylglutathione lyase family enzyme